MIVLVLSSFSLLWRNGRNGALACTDSAPVPARFPENLWPSNKFLTCYILVLCILRDVSVRRRPENLSIPRFVPVIRAEGVAAKPENRSAREQRQTQADGSGS